MGVKKIHHLIGGKLNDISLQEVNGYLVGIFFHQIKGGKGCIERENGKHF